MTKHTIKIATRNSPLALAQTELVKNKLLALFPHLVIELLPMKTTGDRWLQQSLMKIGGKGLFVKELEEALLTHQADIAVHSLKDLPAELPPGLTLGAVCERGSVHDVLISRHHQSLQKLAAGSVIGTSSLRRVCQIKALRPDVDVCLMRGNVNSRIEKLEQGVCDALILAAAGIERLGLGVKIAEHFNPQEFIPAIGQGALGIECRADDAVVAEYLQPLNSPATDLCIRAERALSASLGGSCHIPLGGYAFYSENGAIQLKGLVGHPDGHPIYKSEVVVDQAQPEKGGQDCAHKLLVQGADKILKELNCT